MLLKIVFGCIALYHLLWTGNIILGLLALIMLSQLEIISKLGEK
jgi:hypothetical protein